MALVIADRVKETSLTTGTSTIVLAGAAGGFQSFAVIGNGNSTYYCIAGQGSNQWEVGIGTYTASGTTLSRDTVLSSSAGGTTKVTFSSGAKDVFVTYPSEKSVNLDASGNVTNLGDITSGVWKGTTIDTPYGGTGLGGATPFTGANNAVYSTSASALTAGTLPVPAGGTGLASYTAGDLSYYTSGTALSKLPIGASTTILTSNATAPQWSATSGISVGNATTADTLTTARNIAGVSFDGSANIVIPLENLSDVSIGTAVVNQLLGYNGTAWTNVAPNPASAGTGVVFYNATPVITAAGANNDVPILTFASIPVTTAEQVITGTAVSNTVEFSAFVTVALNRLIFDAGIYDFTIWAGVDSIAGGSVTTITRQIYTATPFVVGTVTTTGTGSSRTATASSGTPFATSVIDASATNTVASYLQTPQGLYQITARTSDTVVTITTPSGYTNESAVAGTVWKKLFGVTTPEITSISPNYTQFDVYTTQPSTVVTTATKMGILGFVTSDATRTISLTYNGEDRNTHVNTPLANLHNDLAGLQGGAAAEYYHLNSTQYAALGAAGNVAVTNDATTNATMYPTWVTANTGTLPVYVSSTKLSFNPSLGKLTVNTVGIGLGGGSVSTNTSVGVNALLNNTTGTNNTALGYNALTTNTIGTNNTALGHSALKFNTTGIQNTAIGVSALQTNTTGAYNVAVGYQALYSNTAGDNNTALGTSALQANTTGFQNTALGTGALQVNTIGVNNTAVGFNTLTSNTTGDNNTALGTSALQTNTTGISNTAIGFTALYLNTIGTYNTALGYAALQNNTTGDNNTALGTSALAANTTGNNNVAVGTNALTANTTGVSNTALGTNALTANTTGINNVAVGYQALSANKTSRLTAVGYQALKASTTGADNTALGYNALAANTTGLQNIALGGNALAANTIGNNNTAVGFNALAANTTGGTNIAVGTGALQVSTIGNNNVAVGYTTLYSNTTGIQNTAVGYAALQTNTIGIGNTAVGSSALISSTGSYNTVVGTYQGVLTPIMTSGSNWTVLSDGQANVKLAIDVNSTLWAVNGQPFFNQGASTAKAAAATLTAAEVLTGIISCTGTAYTLTLPTATLLDAAISGGNLPINMAFDFSISNAATGIVTVAIGVGITAVGNLAVGTIVAARFRLRKTAANAFSLYKIA